MTRRVIAKGNYTHRQISRFLAVTQYVIYEEDGKRFLLLRFVNGSSEMVTSFRMLVERFTEEGKSIGSEQYGYSGPPVLAGEEFGPFESIPLENFCADFRVEILSVRSHDYVYEVKKNSVTVRYLPEEERTDMSALMRKTGGKRLVVASATKRMTAALIAVTLLLAGAIGAFSLFRNVGAREQEEESSPAAAQYAGQTAERERYGEF